MTLLHQAAQKAVEALKRSSLYRRLRCVVTLNHIDPGVRCVGQQLTACKKCGKVWRVWK